MSLDCLEVVISSNLVSRFIVNTLLALEKNGTLTSHELTEVVEQSLTKLKTLDALPSVQAKQQGNLLASSLRSFTRVSLAIEAPASPTKAKMPP
jgi:hypothetical protein